MLKDFDGSEYAYILAWNPKQPHLLAAVHYDNIIRVWDTTTQRCVNRVKKTTSPAQILSCAWSPDGKLLGVGSDDEVFALLDAESGAEVGRHALKPSALDEFVWSANDQYLFTATNKRGAGVLSCVQLARSHDSSLRTVRSCGAYSGSAVALAADAGRRRLAVSADDSVVSIWSAKELLCTATLDRFEQAPGVLAFSGGDGRYLASVFSQKFGAASGGGGPGSELSFVDVADAGTGARLAILRCRERAIYGLCWHPTKNVLVYCGLSAAITVVCF